MVIYQQHSAWLANMNVNGSPTSLKAYLQKLCPEIPCNTESANVAINTTCYKKILNDDILAVHGLCCLLLRQMLGNVSLFYHVMLQWNLRTTDTSVGITSYLFLKPDVLLLGI